MNKPSELYAIREPESVAKRNTLHLKLICSHEPATARPVARPWPRQHAWRDRVRQIGKQPKPGV